jgi:hypothetical protein
VSETKSIWNVEVQDRMPRGSDRKEILVRAATADAAVLAGLAAAKAMPAFHYPYVSAVLFVGTLAN